MLRIVLLFVFWLFNHISTANAQQGANQVSVETNRGRFEIDLRRDLSPKHVERFVQLIRSKFYNGVIFHNVVQGYVVYTGDPTGTGMGGSQLPVLGLEASNGAFQKGTVAMITPKDNPNLSNSQFFILLADAPHLDRRYSIIGQVASGLPIVSQIRIGDSINRMDILR